MSGAGAGQGSWLQDLGDRFAAYWQRRWVRLSDPESMIGLFIMTLWTTLAGFGGGWPVVLVLVVIGFAIHAVAVESGNHGMLWFATASLLIFIVIASETLAGGMGSIPLAVAGATALGHNELVRFNYARRRDARIDEDLYLTSTIGVTAAGAIGLLGVVLIELPGSGGDRSWLWVPAAAVGLLAIGFGLTLIPTLGAEPSSKERWEPGERIPPQPLGREDLENH